MERARSYVNAAACPPFAPTLWRVTAGLPVAVVGSENKVAMALAPDKEYRSADPWNWMVWFTRPAPGAEDVFTFR